MTDLSGTGTIDEFAEGGNIVTMEQAEAYFLTRFGIGTKWSGLADEAKASLILTAEGDLLAFYSLDADTATHRTAVYEQALFRLMDSAIDSRAALQAQGVKSSGIIKETYGDSVGVPVCTFARAILGEPIASFGSVDLDTIDED